jgi:hypothetical protein
VTESGKARTGRRQIGGYFDSKVVRMLRRLAADRDATHQVLLAEALNDLFEKYGLERVADETQMPRGGAALKARRSANAVSDGPGS